MLRMATLNDAEAILDIYAPYIENTAVTFEYEPPTASQFRERMSSFLAEYPYLVWVESGEIAGYAYAHRQKERAAYQWNAELSVYLAPQATGRGLGRVLYGALLEILTLQNVRNVYGGVTVPNPPSEKLHEACGFLPLGTYHKTGYKAGQWHDVIWYEKQLGEGVPLPFQPIGTVDGDLIQSILSTAAKEYIAR